MFECQSQNILQVFFCFPANSLNKTLHLYITGGVEQWSDLISCWFNLRKWKLLLVNLQLKNTISDPLLSQSTQRCFTWFAEFNCDWMNVQTCDVFLRTFEISAKLKRCFCSHCKCKKLFDPWACSPIHPTSSILVVLQFKINLIYLVLGLGASPLTEVLFD